jgi:hypothetical protein
MPSENNPLKAPLLSYDGQGKLASEGEILRAIDRYRENAWRARWSRADLNKQAWDFYHGRQDFSHKMKHQSKEFLPDFPMAVEQIAGTIEQGLVDFSDWFDVEAMSDQPIIDPGTIRKLLTYFLERLYEPGNQAESAYTISRCVGDAVKMGLLEAVLTVKVYAVDLETPRFVLERGSVPMAAGNHPVTGELVIYEQPTEHVRRVVIPQTRLAIDIVPWEDFFPDPSNQGLYTIHEVSRSLADLRQNPDYNPEVLDRIAAGRQWTSSGGTMPDYEKRRRSGQAQTEEGALPGRVRETWGRVVDLRDGKELLPEGLVTTAANEFLREPGPNPFWHGKRPFVCAPLVRVPLSSVHKSLSDHAVPMARAQNEMMNLMIDGGLASVWGVRQIRTDLLENPEEVSEGIPQGYTGVLKPGTPVNEKFLERVDDGSEPQFGVDMLNRLGAAFQSALVLPDLARGVLPPRQVKATEIVQAQQASQGLYSVIAGRLEDCFIGPVLELSWQTLWQYLDDFTESELLQLLGASRALALQTLTQEQRFVMLAQAAKFHVRGLRSLNQRQQDFAKITTLLQSIGVNPALLMAFDSKFSVPKLLEVMVKAVGIDPSTIEKTPEEIEAQQAQQAAAAASGGGMPGMPGAPPGPGGPQQGPPAPGTPSSGPTDVGTNGTGGIGSEIEKAMAPANPGGFRGGQM